jgi:hypothetical protein
MLHILVETLTGRFSLIPLAIKLYTAKSELAWGVSEMIRCVPGGGVGDDPEANEEEEDVEVEGVLKWKAEGKRVIFLDSFGGFRGCSSIFSCFGYV